MKPLRGLLVGFATILAFAQSFSYLRTDQASFVGFTFSERKKSCGSEEPKNETNSRKDDVGTLPKMDPMQIASLAAKDATMLEQLKEFSSQLARHVDLLVEGATTTISTASGCFKTTDIAKQESNTHKIRKKMKQGIALTLLLAGPIVLRQLTLGLNIIQQEKKQDEHQVMPESNEANGLHQQAEPHNTHTNTKYILYGSTSGWSNQVKSLEHAYWIAHATNRTLILPPMLYHWDALQGTYYVKPVGQVYNQLLANRPPMTRIVDFDSWGASVPVIDYQTFQQQQQQQQQQTTALSSIQLSKHTSDKQNRTGLSGPFNCANTKFTLNTSLHGLVETAKSCQDHISLNKIDPIKTYTYQHIDTALHPYWHYPVWTFDFLFPSALFDLSSIPSNLFQLHYTSDFRTAVRDMRRNRWNGRPYAAIHIRGGDGPFAKHDFENVVFPRLVNRTFSQILEYHHNHNAAESSLRYLMVIVSDVKALRTRDTTQAVFQVWSKFERRLQTELRANGIDLEVLSPTNYTDVARNLKRSTQSDEAGVYLDQLVAACGDIAFAGSSESSSSFQQRIQLMRKQSVSPC